MKPSPIELSLESEEELSPVDIPLSPSLKKSHSVGNGLGQDDIFPGQQLALEEEPLFDESFAILAEQNQTPEPESYLVDHGKNESSGLLKVRSLPNLATSKSISLPSRSRSFDNLCSLANPFAADSSDLIGDSGSTTASNDGGHFDNMRRIEEWVRQIDMQGSDFPDEPEERKERPKSTPRVLGHRDTEPGQRYTLALAPLSTTAQMKNLGLAVIPFLGAFTNLKILDLCGNAIVRMTTGALPRGLHVLNLSRNNISTIEGLRELTRLRVLDLSFNRILRIGHGLGGCAALKELYLGGNKIGEVEGLHRLLKLNVLDLQKNKISTTKSLGQLAANYASLQALNLQANPVLRNVGEEQLRRHLASLLPRLVYFNKHAMRPVSTKDLAARAAAAAAATVRSDRHHHWHVSRRGSSDRGVGSLQKVAAGTSASRRLRGVAAAPLPLAAGSKLVLSPGALKDGGAPGIGGRLLSSLKPINPLRRIRSEGALQAGQQS